MLYTTIILLTALQILKFKIVLKILIMRDLVAQILSRGWEN